MNICIYISKDKCYIFIHTYKDNKIMNKIWRWKWKEEWLVTFMKFWSRFMNDIVCIYVYISDHADENIRINKKNSF